MIYSNGGSRRTTNTESSEAQKWPYTVCLGELRCSMLARIFNFKLFVSRDCSMFYLRNKQHCVPSLGSTCVSFNMNKTAPNTKKLVDELIYFTFQTGQQKKRDAVTVHL